MAFHSDIRRQPAEFRSSGSYSDALTFGTGKAIVSLRHLGPARGEGHKLQGSNLRASLRTSNDKGSRHVLLPPCYESTHFHGRGSLSRGSRSRRILQAHEQPSTSQTHFFPPSLPWHSVHRVCTEGEKAVTLQLPPRE